jgi:hypothetical protein
LPFSVDFSSKIGYNTPGLPPLGAEGIADISVKSANPTRIPAFPRHGTSYLSSALCPLSSFLYFCRRSSTNPPFSCKTNPISKTARINATSFISKGYDNMAGFASPKTNPKRTQTNPKQTQFFARQGLPKPKRTQTNPNEPNFKRRQKAPAVPAGKRLSRTEYRMMNKECRMLKCMGDGFTIYDLQFGIWCLVVSV